MSSCNNECAAQNPGVVERMTQVLDAQLARDNPKLPEDLVGHHP
jgi:hypothetical protein